MTTTPTPPTEPKSVVVLASGSGTLLQSILDHQDEHYRVTRVVADVDCRALERAAAAGVATQLVQLGDDRDAWNVALAEAVAEGAPDIVVSAGFMKILGAGFLERFEGITINTHPALLPAFPGAHAVRDALDYGVKVTGSTVHFVDAGVDTGRIIAQKAVTVAPEDTEESLHEKIKTVERALIVSVLRSAQKDNPRKVVFHER
ncbi:phosphoribosylglycinamide formyltransferase [Corynebacterium yudongzhengii]|uniref:Phosphoribosylglycinamide formyltransferase n=1 Tax=Corynebacterium yudongzhengii TaxID=2080740 RepID=A0A2U1T7W8_9CORY|nr:phosphoribosylglycinamide formyltransferase [Corynebacterium yudongzhengii]AWB82316.1 phosphoribosylglycinamide formyltransferase [Corynebacterium yudongzhengii]PWC02065.1 phosphoribosylglycinamide formyltransferase [Corynebacterium yudongzhengii]